jgi:hypothetical protein
MFKITEQYSHIIHIKNNHLIFNTMLIELVIYVKACCLELILWDVALV